MKKTTKKTDEVKHEGVRFAELPVSMQGAAVGSAYDMLCELDAKDLAGDSERENCELHRYRLDGNRIDAIYPAEMFSAGEPIKWGLGRDPVTWELLLPGDASLESSPTGFVILPRAEIAPWPGQPRKHFDEAAQVELDASMAAKGFDEAFPLIVRATHGAVPFELAAGERRWRSAGRVGIERVPCIVRDLSDDEMMEMALVENLQREGLSALEEALGYRALIGSQKRTLAEVAKMIGKSVDTVRDRLALCKLAGTPTGAALEARLITPRHAAALARVPSDKSRDELLAATLKPAGQPGPLPAAELERRIMLDFVRDLRGCKFDVADVTLVPEQADAEGNRTMGGACASCPFNTLVADPSRKGKSSGAMCSHPECYRAKEVATHERWRAAQTVETLPAEENARLWNQTGKELAYNSPYVDLDAKPERADIGAKADELPKWSALVKGAEVPILLAVDAAGKVRTLARREVVVEAVKTQDAEKPAEKRVLEEPKKAKKTDATAEAEAKQKAAQAALDARMERAEWVAVVTAARLPITKLSDAWLGMALTTLAYRVNEDDLAEICVRRGWATDTEVLCTDFLLKKADELPQHDGVSLLTELLLAATADLADFIDSWAAAVGVDLKKVRKAEEVAIKAEETTRAGKDAVIKGLKWSPRRTEVEQFEWAENGLCKNVVFASVAIGKPLIASISIARTKEGWVYGFSLEGAGPVIQEVPALAAAKYSTPELATVSALTALRQVIERNGGTDEQLARLTDYIKLTQKGGAGK